MLEHHESFSPEPAGHSSGASDALRADFFDSTLSKAIGSRVSAVAAPDVSAPTDAAPPAGISAASWAQVNQWAASDTPVKFIAPGEGGTPDYIIGADGTMTKNPAAVPSADGSITIQAADKKAAQALQVATVQSKISYWQKANPKATDIPNHLKSELNAAQNMSTTPDVAPQQQRPDGGSPGGGGFGGPGSESIGGKGIGHGGYRPGNFEPNGPIDRGAIPKPVAGDLDIKGPPSCTPEQIQTFLEKMGSPAAREQGFSQALYDACTNRGIDPAVAVGFFLQESTCGRYGRGHENHSMGNIKGSAPESGGSDGTFRRYGTWAEGARDWARLIDDSYVQKRGLQTLSQVISVYAPSSDGNNERGYVSTVKGVVEAFKHQNENKSALA